MDNQTGIFVTEIGASVPTAADYQYVFNSNWPSLQTAFDQTLAIGVVETVTVAHNLGFAPLIMAWVVDSSGDSLGRIFAASQTFEDLVDLNYPQTLLRVTWDSQNIYIDNTRTDVSWIVNVVAYNIPLTTAANYTLPQYPAVKQPYDPNTYIKVTKYGKGITSTDMRDFILNSQCQSPAVLSIVTGNSSGAISYANPANYVPWTLGFYDNGAGLWTGMAPGQQQSGALFELGENLSFTGSNGTTTVANGAIMASTNTSNLTLAVLRDPLTVPKIVEATY